MCSQPTLFYIIFQLNHYNKYVIYCLISQVNLKRTDNTEQQDTTGVKYNVYLALFSGWQFGYNGACGIYVTMKNNELI